MNWKFGNIILVLFLLGVVNLSKANSIADVDSLNDLSYDLGSSYPDSAFALAKKSLLYAKKIGYVQGQMTAHCRLGRIVYKSGDLDSSLHYFNQAEQTFSRWGKDSIFLAKTWIYQGLVNRKLGNLDVALNKYVMSYALAQSQNDEVLMGSCLINASNILKSQGKYESALNYLHKAVENFADTSYNEVGSIHLNIGNIYEIQNRNADALISYKKAFQNFNELDDKHSLTKVLMGIGNLLLDSETPDSALYYYDQSYDVAEKNNYQEILAQLSQNKGEYYFANDQLDSAKVYFSNSLLIKEGNRNNSNLSLTLERLGDIYIAENKVKKAKNQYLASYQYAGSLEDYFQLKDITYKISSTYLLLSKLDSALLYLEYSKSYQDSISERLNEALVYEINYNNEKHKVEKLNLKIEQQASDLKKSDTINWLSIAVVILILGALIAVIVYFRQRQKTQKKQKEIDDLLNKQGEETMNAMLNGQETEKTRIASELHDRLGSMLSTVKLYFKSMDKEIDQLKEENISQFEKANDLLDEACEEVRKIAHDLSTGVLHDQGLFRAVKNLKEKLEGTGEIQIELLTHGTDDDLVIVNQSATYRIIQESLSNILKHAEAKKVSIQLNVFEDLFNLIVEDDGKGFDANEMVNNSGMGLRSNKARVNKMNGTFNIDSGKGIGTTINIDIPLEKEK